YEETETFTFEIYNMNSVVANPGLYNYLVDLTDGYGYGQMQHVTVDISLLDYNTAYLEKNLNGFNLFFTSDTGVYEFGIDASGNIELLNDPVAHDEYSLTFTGLNNAYQDLFYEEIVVEFEIVSFDSLEGVGTLDPNPYVVLSELLTENYEYNETIAPFIWVNDVQYQNYYSVYDIGSDLALIEIDGPTLNIYSDRFEEYNETFDVGDEFRIIFKIYKTWTQAHDYGRIRTNASTLYLNQQSDTSALLSHSESTNVINVNNIAVGDEIVMQSPYTDFSVSYGNVGFPRTYLVEQENIAAVKMIKNSSDNTNYTFILFYWENGSVVSRTVNNINLANRNSLNIKFDGGFRKALNYSDVMVANVDLLTPLEDFLPNMVAWDAIDGDISDSIVITDNDGYSPDTVGIYNVEFSVTNSNGQTSSIIAPVHVVDIVNPVINGVSDTVHISYDQTFNVTNWVNSLTVSDNYYTGLSISIKENTYTVNKNKLGTYKITVQAVDPSGNIGTLTRTIVVNDGIGPVFNGINTITASINENITVEQIKAGLAAIDAIDGNVTTSIVVDSDNLTGKANTVGVYEVVFRAVDAAGNQTFHTVTVSIVASPPGFYILNSNSVRLLPGANLTIEQILNILNASDAENISTNYTVSVPGTYNLSFTLYGESHQVSITVLGQNDSIIPTPVIPGESNPGFNITYALIIGLSAIALLATTVTILNKKRK
nr:envelope protein [Plasmavirus L2]